MAVLNIYYVASAVAGLLILRLLGRQTARRTLPYPPGPKPLPLIGNLLDLPKEKDWLTYRAWSNQYGDIVSVDVLGQKIVILGSASVVDDLMEKRGAIYSSRPWTPMIEMMKFEWSFVVLPYGEAWRRKRKLMHTHVHQGASDQFHPIQTASARRFVRDVLAGPHTPDALPRAVRLNFAQMITKAVYGIDIESYESEYIALPEKVLVDFGEVCTPGRFLVDFIPVLKHVPAWMPGASFKRRALKNHITQRAALENPINVVKSQMAAGTAPSSMSRTMLEEDAALPADKSQLDIIGDVAGLAYLAGSDTTVAAVHSLFLAMLVYPEVQAKAQAEIDRIVGKDRLPELEDRRDMPYVESVVNECLRWHAVAPMAVPHQTTQDDEYKGYFIPKGTIVLGPVWGILHNADDYPDPERFNPERFLTPDGQLDSSVRDPRTACFGFGRRICPGRFIADASLFIMVSTLLATVNIVRAKDAQGNEIIPDVDVTSGVLSHPKPFPWAVESRGPRVSGLLHDAQAH